MVARGLRNNNPGNIVLTNIPWFGKVPNAQNTDKRFEQFKTMAYGIRAMLLDLYNKIGKGINTPRKLISVWAPPSENNTQNYIQAVSKALGVGPDTALTGSKETLAKLAFAISAMENGKAISADEFEHGYSLLPASKKKG